ncbi:uncharacterized protein LOC108197876 isoform X1 [Daucus carota subsp. sativus]|uniref:uncharacterized protein LOC108197876 isoform X1 n=1 Tax=Daucus carota subsp. sativus TaxID=79200 RepID=UPI0030830D1D
MGFDNDCIVNIQSLAGEYFCAVCRTLVYPTEALQSQCTHLFCKPCLTYVVGTTKACPYDGYLVTDKDSKPLVESDKALAERIGKTPVHCLFHRSGCSWQGTLSECTSHRSDCAFGYSPVVCNRCGMLLLHRQVQNHAQICAGAKSHLQQTAQNSKDAATAVAVNTANSGQASSQPVAHTSQAAVPQITMAPPTTQEANPYVQAIASSAGMTAEQWQQYQQYYQQYPGCVPYQQYYYPYQQPAQPVHQQAPYAGQPQVYPQPLTGMQGHHQPLPQVQGQGPAQTQRQPQGQPQAHSFVQNQVNPKQQSHIQVDTQTAAQSQILPQQPPHQAQPHMIPNSLQPPAQTNLQVPYQQPPYQGNLVQLQSQPQPVLQSQSKSHHYPHPLQPNNPPSQQPAPGVLPGYQSHPLVQPNYQMLQASQQHYSMPMQPSSGPLPPSAQFPQQSPHIRPPQTNASLPSQEQSQSQTQGFPPVHHPQHLLQGYIGHQRPAAPGGQPIQQHGQQSTLSQASISVPSALKPMQPQGPIQSQQNARPPPPSHGSVQAHGMAPQQPPPSGSRPAVPNQTATSHPFPQCAPHSRPLPLSSVQPSEQQQQVASGLQFSQSDREITHKLGGGSAAAQVGSTLNKTAGNDVSFPGEDSVRIKAFDSEIRGKSGDVEHNIRIVGENKGNQSQVAEAVVDALKSGSSEPLMEKTVKEKAATPNEMHGSVFAVKDSTSRQRETYVGHKKDNSNVLAHENKLSHGQVSQQGPAMTQYSGFHDKGRPKSSNPTPLTDQGRYQMPSGPYGLSSQQQRLAISSHSQSGSYIGAPPNALPGQGPAHLNLQGPGLSGPLHPIEHFRQSSSSHTHESLQGVQRGQYYQNNSSSQPLFSRTNKAEPTGPLHGSNNAGPLQNPRLRHLEGRYPDPNVSGSFNRGLHEETLANENRVHGAALGLHVKNVNDDHMNQFRTGPAGRNGQGEYEQALKQFPKPANIGNGSSEAGDYPHEHISEFRSKFLPPYTSNAPPEFHGSGPGFGVDHLPPRSPRREFYGIPSHGFGGQSGGPHNQPGLDNVNGWGPNAFPEGPRSFHISSDPIGRHFNDHFKSGDMAGQDFIPNHMRVGELFGPRDVPSHISAVKGFGTFPDPHMVELNGNGGFPYAQSYLGNLRLGEPGFRSSFYHDKIPRPGGFYEGNVESSDSFRHRMPKSTVRCRICKVNCDGLEGLDLHSRTAEHLQRTMDMVTSIKLHAKRQKIIKDRSSGQEGIKPKKAGKRRRKKA